jgi:hypothetical protein
MTPEEKARKLGVPMIGPLRGTTNPPRLDRVMAVCGECGREVHYVESYSCPNGRCPIQIRATC